MLVVFRKVRPGVGSPECGDMDVAEVEVGSPEALAKEVVLSVGTAGVVFAFASLGVGSPDEVTARRGVVAPGVGMLEAADPGREEASLGISGSGLRVFAMGSAGSGPVGGGWGGRDEVLCGSAEVMVAVTDMDVEPMRLPERSLLLLHLAANYPGPGP